MVGNMTFESSSASPEELTLTENYPNGQRRNCPIPALVRSGSFRDGLESQMFFSGTNTPRGSTISAGELPALVQCLILDPITMAARKYILSGEVRRVLGISSGSTAEDNSFGASYLKPPPPIALEGLKRLKASVVDSSVEARSRAKKLDESLHKLNKYCEAFSLKKQQRNEMFINERVGRLNLLKVGTLIRRKCPDLITQEERSKLNKRVRSSVAEIQAEGRSYILGRHALVMGKSEDMPRDAGEGSDLVEENIRKLSAGGEGWDQKMKRKRSVGTIFNRSVDTDGVIKRVMHRKPKNEPGQFCDNLGFRFGSSNGTNGIHKSNKMSMPASSGSHAVLRNELEKGSLSRDFVAGLNKERLVVKVNNKLSIVEDSHTVPPSPVTKGKTSKAPRMGPVMAETSSPNFSRTPGTLEGWERPLKKVTSVSGVNNRKRLVSTGSLSSPMACWGGQRPQKLSRTKRTNLVSPVSSHDEVKISSEGHSPSDLSVLVTSNGNNESLLARSVVNSTQQLRMKYESVSSPAQLSGSEESGAGQNLKSRLKEKGAADSEVEENSSVHNVGPPALPVQKNKTVTEEVVGDGVRRQGRTSRGSSISRASNSLMREKLEKPGLTKPHRTSRHGSDKIGSKSGRPPLKKMSDRRSVFRLGQTPNGNSPDFTGESYDDREELFKAANFASNASYLACSSSFWKKMELNFASVSLEDISNLKQQLKSIEELHESLSQMHCHEYDNLDDCVHDEEKFLNNLPGKGSQLDQTGSRESARTVGLVDQIEDSARRYKVTPLYQRVLSALILEDEIAEFEENGGCRNTSFQYSGENSPDDTCLPMDVSLANMDNIEREYESLMGIRSQKQCTVDRLSCNMNAVNNGSSFLRKLCNDDLSNNRGCMPSKIGTFPYLSKNGLDGPEALHANVYANSSFDYQYEQMSLDEKLLLELQSIGIYPEMVPDLADREGEIINKEIVELQKGLCQQVGEGKEKFNKLLEAVEEGRELAGRGLVRVAMDRLVELTYEKQLATRGSSSRSGVPKVSKQVASSFKKRTLARCWKFEATGKSCFSEPFLREVILAAPANRNDAESIKSIGSAVAPNMQPETRSFSNKAEWRDCHTDKLGIDSSNGLSTPSYFLDQEFAKSGPVLNRGKKKELLLDDVGVNASLRVPSPLGYTLSGAAKGKRSERERVIDTSTRNSVAKVGSLSVGNVKGERKVKTMPKQKSTQLSTSGHGFINKFMETSPSVYPAVSSVTDKKREVSLMSNGNVCQDPSKEAKEPPEMTNLQLNELDEIEELGVANDLDGNQDLSTWLNFDDDGLQDHGSMGLEIPMDDLSDLNMII